MTFPTAFTPPASAATHCTYLRNYLARNHSTPTEHANAIDGSVLNNSAIGQNIFEDIEGTSITVPTCGKYCDWQNDAIYSNLVFCTVRVSVGVYWAAHGGNVAEPAVRRQQHLLR